MFGLQLYVSIDLRNFTKMINTPSVHQPNPMISFEAKKPNPLFNLAAAGVVLATPINSGALAQDTVQITTPPPAQEQVESAQNNFSGLKKIVPIGVALLVLGGLLHLGVKTEKESLSPEEVTEKFGKTAATHLESLQNKAKAGMINAHHLKTYVFEENIPIPSVQAGGEVSQADSERFAKFIGDAVEKAEASARQNYPKVEVDTKRWEETSGFGEDKKNCRI